MDNQNPTQVAAACASITDTKLAKADKTLRIASRVATAGLMLAAGAAHAGGGGLSGITNSVQQVAVVVAACGALIATIGIGICGYKVTMEGATFRDISNKLLGCGIIGGASAIAGAFGVGTGP